MDVEKHEAFAQDLVNVMRKHNARASDITYTLGWHGPFEQARMAWHRGRHDDAGAVNLILTTHHEFKEVR